MRKLELVNVGDELYEVIRRYPMAKFSNNLSGENAEIVKQWIGSEKILISKQTNEYLFVNLIPDAIIITEENDKPTNEKG
jgi:hypothetical protein